MFLIAIVNTTLNMNCVKSIVYNICAIAIFVYLYFFRLFRKEVEKVLPGPGKVSESYGYC